MSGKLIIQGKAWGEFESAKRSKGNIEINGYRSYGGTHTVRMVEQPQLDENQQIVLEWLKEQVSIGNDLQYVLWEFTDNVYEEPAEYSVSEQTKAWLELTEQEQFQVLQAFSQWALEQEEE